MPGKIFPGILFNSWFSFRSGGQELFLHEDAVAVRRIAAVRFRGTAGRTVDKDQPAAVEDVLAQRAAGVAG